MLACKRKAHRGLLHVKHRARLQRADLLMVEALDLCRRSTRSTLRWAVLVQLTAAGMGCVCTCVSKFETACTQARGRVVTTGSDLVGCVAPDGAVLATWMDELDGGEP